jgi:hypothetical protein
MELSTELTVNVLLVTTNAALIAEMMFEGHTLRKIALMRAKRRLSRLASKDDKRNAAPVAPIVPSGTEDGAK